MLGFSTADPSAKFVEGLPPTPDGNKSTVFKQSYTIPPR